MGQLILGVILWSICEVGLPQRQVGLPQAGATLDTAPRLCLPQGPLPPGSWALTRLFPRSLLPCRDVSPAAGSVPEHTNVSGNLIKGGKDKHYEITFFFFVCLFSKTQTLVIC